MATDKVDPKAAAAAAPAGQTAAEKGDKKTVKPRLNQDLKIKILAEANPKREGSKSRERFAFYKNGQTVGQFIQAGGTTADVRYDVEHKYIQLIG